MVPMFFSLGERLVGNRACRKSPHDATPKMDDNGSDGSVDEMSVASEAGASNLSDGRRIQFGV